MRILVFCCAMMAVIVCDPAVAASRSSHTQEALCIAVFEVASSLYEEDGTIPEKVEGTRALSKRMHQYLALDSTVAQSKQLEKTQSAEQDRLYALVNAEQSDAALDSVYRLLAQDVDRCSKLLPGT